jgi:glycine dehydrogenase subunit 1
VVSYLPNTDTDRVEMLKAIGLDSIDPLFALIPAGVRNPKLHLPAPLTEPELMAEMRKLARLDVPLEDVACFRGGGAYHHFIPSAVRAITSRSEFATSYTPYQPEISQGTLQAIFEFQSLICQLTGMEVANASMYDGSTALAEAALMAQSITRKNGVVISGAVHPEYQAVARTYLTGREAVPRVLAVGDGLTSTDAAAKLMDNETAALVVQYPNFFGGVEDLPALSAVAHAYGAQFIVVANPLALGLLRSPGACGADIVVGEGQPLGISIGFGGPYLGIMATREASARQLPGRLVGMTNDSREQRGFVLTLQTREQHIRREKATSNICSNEALCALAATVYLSLMGPHGLRRVAEVCLRRAHYLADRIAELPGFTMAFATPYFHEFVVHCPASPATINRRLAEAGILGGLALGDWYPEMADCMLFCATEMNSLAQIDRLVSELAGLPVEVEQ